MKLDTLSIVYNNYNFPNDGIEPQSYGGKVVFKDTNGSYTQINLSASAIDQIMQTVASEVASNARKMLEELDVKTIRDSARPLAITHDETIEEAVFSSRDEELPL